MRFSCSILTYFECQHSFCVHRLSTLTPVLPLLEDLDDKVYNLLHVIAPFSAENVKHMCHTSRPQILLSSRTILVVSG
jgi:hypothetical protein